MLKPSSEKPVRILAIALLLVYSIIQAYASGGDFDVFLNAAATLGKHGNIYGPPFVRDLQYFYSPFFALILLPFSYLPNFIVEILWLWANVFFIFRLWTLFLDYFDLPVRNNKYYIWCILSYFLIARFAQENFLNVQMTIFMLWAVFESFSLLHKKKIVWAALLLALSINIKIMPLPFLIYWFYKGHYKACAYTCLFTVLFILLPGIFIGSGYNAMLHLQWWDVLSSNRQNNAVETSQKMVSLSSVLPYYINIPAEWVFLTLNIIRVLLISVCLAFTRRLLATEKQTINEFKVISYICLVLPLIFPHQQKYSFFFAFPAITLLLHHLVYSSKKGSGYYTIFCIISIYTFCTVLSGKDILGSRLYDMLDNYRPLTFGILTLIPALLLTNASVVPQRKYN